MTDLTDRMRTLYATHPVVMEAADEIERLTDVHRWSFDDLVAIAKRILDYNYPADIFTGESRDSGPRFVAALRKVIEEIERD
jgi:hypothetical protein